MAIITTEQLTADGNTPTTLLNKNSRDRHIYTVYLSGTFGSGTVTAFLNADGTNNIPILDSANIAISLTANGMFNFEANSDTVNPVKLILTLAGSSGAAINARVINNV